MQPYVKLTIFLLLQVSAQNTIVCAKNNCFNGLKIKKVKCFTQSPTKMFCISVFNVGGCLVS